MDMYRILVVDDEEDIAELVRYNLTSEGYHVSCTGSGEDAIRLIRSEPFDLVVLDLMLPGMSGIKVAKTLRSDPKVLNIPIIMLTAKGEEPDIVTGLELADDYVTKPFSPKILGARISAVLRRKSEPSEKDILRRGDISIDPGRRRVEVCGEPVELSFYGISDSGDAVQASGLGIYPLPDCGCGPRRQLSGNRAQRGCPDCRASKKTGTSCGHYIETVRSVGYRFKENP